MSLSMGLFPLTAPVPAEPCCSAPLLRPGISVSTWTAVGFGGSLLVEACQALLPGRFSNHVDAVANTLSAALGALVAWVVLRARRQ